MTKARRDKRLDQTRWVEWGYYGLSAAALLTALALGAAVPLLWTILALSFLGGFGVWALQYRTQDELGKLRFIKSWALSGLLTSVMLTLVMVWAALDWLSLPALYRPKALFVPFWPIYAVTLAGALSASLASVYLRKRDERE